MFGCFHSSTKGCIRSTAFSGDNTTATWAFFSWTAFSQNYWCFSLSTSLAIFFVVNSFTLIKEKTSATSKALMVASKGVM